MIATYYCNVYCPLDKDIAPAKEMYQTIAKLGRLFRELCAKTLRKAVMK
jgi:hypothetical protein